MTGLGTRLRIITGEAEAVGESDDAQVSRVLSLLILRLTRGQGSKSTWPLSNKSVPSDQIVMSSGDNFGTLQLSGCMTYLTHLRRRRRPRRYLVWILSIYCGAEPGE